MTSGSLERTGEGPRRVRPKNTYTIRYCDGRRPLDFGLIRRAGHIGWDPGAKTLGPEAFDRRRKNRYKSGGNQMKKHMLFLLALLILVPPGCTRAQVNLIAPQEKQNGMSYACWEPGLYSLPDSDISLAHLAETGAGWISLIVTCYQDNLGSTRIAADESTPTDEDLIHVLNQAQALGLKVMLKPHVDLSHDPSHWRGEIGQAFSSESDWSEWFASYRVFIEHYADLAAAHGADQFCVGCELEGTTSREADWRLVVSAVRSLYAGPLIYAGNHSGEEVGMTWWDAVDIIGVDAYYPLSSETDPTLEELRAAWKPYVASLASLSAKWQKPIILTEIGYRSLDGAARYPWDWQIQGKVDLQEQADCYQAALESIYNEPWFAGIYWWSWSPDPLEGGPEDAGYTPHGKPAEEILRMWFGGQHPRAPRRSLERDPAKLRRDKGSSIR
jgi:Glycoside Hydrolase Family 113